MKLNMFLFGFIFIGYQISLLASELPEKFEQDPTLVGISGQEENFKELEERFESAELNDFEKLFLKENELKSMKQSDALKIVSDVEGQLSQWVFLKFHTLGEEKREEAVRQQFRDIVKAVKERLLDLQFYSSKPQASSEPSELPAQPVQPEKPELSKAELNKKIEEQRESFEAEVAKGSYHLLGLGSKESFFGKFTTLEAARNALKEAYGHSFGKALEPQLLLPFSTVTDALSKAFEEVWQDMLPYLSEMQEEMKRVMGNVFDLIDAIKNNLHPAQDASVVRASKIEDCIDLAAAIKQARGI